MKKLSVFFLFVFLLGNGIGYSNSVSEFLPRWEDMGSRATVTDFRVTGQDNPPFSVKRGYTLPIEIDFIALSDIVSLKMRTYIVINGINIPFGGTLDMGTIVKLPVRSGETVRFRYSLNILGSMPQGQTKLIIECMDQVDNSIVALKTTIEIL